MFLGNFPEPNAHAHTRTSRATCVMHYRCGRKYRIPFGGSMFRRRRDVDRVDMFRSRLHGSLVRDARRQIHVAHLNTSFDDQYISRSFRTLHRTPSLIAHAHTLLAYAHIARLLEIWFSTTLDNREAHVCLRQLLSALNVFIRSETLQDLLHTVTITLTNNAISTKTFCFHVT